MVSTESRDVTVMELVLARPLLLAKELFLLGSLVALVSADLPTRNQDLEQAETLTGLVSVEPLS